MGRIAELLGGRFARGKVLFSGARRRMTSVEVRGDQVAREIGGLCVRSKYLSDASVKTAPALVWIVEPNMDSARRFQHMAPQIFDVINPAYEEKDAFYERCRFFKFLLLNTRSTLNYMGPPRSDWRTWVVHHHHCNVSGFMLPEERLAKPLTVGYVGQPEHLHDAEAIQSAVERMGLRFLNVGTWSLDSYRDIDIGVAWTRREEQRDQTRSSIKLVNFASHGIPSVVCDYESYRDANERLGNGSCVIRSDFSGLLEGIHELARNEELRSQISSKARSAQELFSLASIGNQYRQIVAECQVDFRASREV